MHEFDLNLLKVLAAVAKTRSVSRAAEDLNMSQPGVSSALARMRTLTGDRLLVRTAKGMQLTPKAEDLFRTTVDLLARINTAVNDKDRFDALTADTTFRLAMSDVGEMAMLPALLADFRVHAPLATIQMVSAGPAALGAALEAGSVDVAVGYMPDLTGAGIYQQQLFLQGFCCLLRVDHPVGRQQLTREDYETLDHVVVHTPVRSQEVIDREIERLKIRRRVRVHSPHYLSVPVVVAGSDLVATVPDVVGRTLVDLGLLRAMAPPFQAPLFPVRQHWHARYNDEPRNRWLRERIQQLFGTKR